MNRTELPVFQIRRIPNTVLQTSIAVICNYCARIVLGCFLSVCILTLTSCTKTGKEQSLGEHDVITIIADSADFFEMEDVIENAFGRTIFTPQLEQWFSLVRYDLKDLLDHKRDRNILIVSPLDAETSVGKYLRSSLDSAVRDLVRNERENVFVKKDLWYNGQTVMYLTGSTMENLRNFMLNNSERLFYFFKKGWDEREKKHMLSIPREEDIEERFLDTYGWSLGIIKGWFVGKDSSELKSVWLRRQTPIESERWALVNWIDTTDTQLLNNDSIFKIRNRLTEIFYRTYDDAAYVRIDSAHHLQFDEVDFQGKFAVRMQGLWQMSDFSMGGPFVSYMFYDEDQKRIYFLDGSVFAPKFEKKKLIQDVDVMLQTIRMRSLQPTASK